MNYNNDLISGIDDQDLADLIKRGDNVTSAELRQLLGGDETERILAESENLEMEAATAAGLYAPPDPTLPEIVLIHGITDSHLADVSRRHNRIWLDFIELIKGRFTKTLTLLPDGEGDQPGVVMKTDGFAEKKYSRALAAWTTGRFRNQVFCYDWRHSVRSAAEDLNQFLRGLDSVRNGEKVILVCHSMGGLVAATFAARYPDWENLIEHCIFVGSPLGGSYSVAMAVLGSSPSFQKMERLSVFEDLEDFQRMAASFPGLIDMLPNPEILPEAKDFYTQAGWPGTVKPAQVHLDASRDLKAVLWKTPLIRKATALVSQGHDTAAEIPWNSDSSARAPEIVSREGDGAVLTKCSLAPDLPAYRVTGEHGMLLNEPLVHEAVMAIARGGCPALPSISREQLTGETVTADLRMATGLALPPVEEELQTRIGQSMALHFASEEAVSARAFVVGEPGFDRKALRSEDFSWKNALSMGIASEDAYRSDDPDMRVRATRDWGFQDYKTFDNDETQGFVCWDDEVVLLSFRGSEKKVADWLRDLTLVSYDTGNSRYGEVHKGFFEGFQVVAPQVVAHLHAAGASGKKVYVTGHSLGAAIGIIAGAELRAMFPNATFSFYTYGQPKIGKDALAAFYDRHYSGRYFRFRNNDDIVTRIPPNYSHFGDLLWFDRIGELKGTSSGALMDTVSLQVLESQSELSEAEFRTMQEQLDAVSEPPSADPGALFLPPTDVQIEGALWVPNFGVTDHFMAKSYLPVIRKHWQREQAGA